MSRMIFVNLPVADLARSRGFLEALGAVNEPQVHRRHRGLHDAISDSIHVMLLTHDKFRQFTPRPIADAKAGSRGAAVPVGRQPRKRRYGCSTRP